MSTVVLFLVVLAVTGGAAGLGRGRFGRRRAAEAHHRALDTMGRLAARHAGSPPPGAAGGSGDREPPVAARPARPAAPAHVRLVGRDESPPASPEPPRLRSRPRHASTARPEPDPPAGAIPPRRTVDADAGPAVLVFDDIRRGPAPPSPTAVPLQPAARHVRGRHRAAGRHVRARPRSIGWRSPFVLGTAGTVLVAASVIVGFAIGRSGHGPPAGVTVDRPSGVVGATTTAPPAPADVTRPSTDAAVTAAAPTLLSAGAGFAVYRLGPPGAVSVAASGPCWIEVRTGGPSGPLTFQGTLVAGQTHSVAGAAWLRLGDPAMVAITVNGSRLVPPGLQAGQPYDVQFE